MLVAVAGGDGARARAAREGARKLERFRPFTVKVDITREELDVFLANQMDLPRRGRAADRRTGTTATAAWAGTSSAT